MKFLQRATILTSALGTRCDEVKCRASDLAQGPLALGLARFFRGSPCAGNLRFGLDSIPARAYMFTWTWHRIFSVHGHDYGANSRVNLTNWNSTYGPGERGAESGPRSDSRTGNECVKPGRSVQGGTFDAMEMQSVSICKAFHKACSVGSRGQMPAVQTHRVQSCSNRCFPFWIATVALTFWGFGFRFVPLSATSLLNSSGRTYETPTGLFLEKIRGFPR